MRDSIVFYRSFYEAVKDLPPDDFKKAVVAIMEYGLNDKEPETTGIEKTVFIMAKPQIDKNNNRYENGKRGGKPSVNQTVTKPEPNQNQTITNPKPNVNVNDNVNVNVNDKKNSSARFTPPTLQQVRDYATEKGYNSFDADRFIDFYSCKGWMVGKNKIKDWKAAVRNWNRGQRQESTTKTKKTNQFNNINQRNYDYTELEKRLLR